MLQIFCEIVTPAKTIEWVKQLLSTDCWNTRVHDRDGQAENFGEYGDRAKKYCKVKVFNYNQIRIQLSDRIIARGNVM